MNRPAHIASAAMLAMFMSSLVVDISSACSTGRPVRPMSTVGCARPTRAITSRICCSGRSITLSVS